jgi:hypothetical protein
LSVNLRKETNHFDRNRRRHSKSLLVKNEAIAKDEIEEESVNGRFGKMGVKNHFLP